MQTFTIILYQFNYLFAQKNNGKLILRIEDTDQKRLVKNSIENIIYALKWAGSELWRATWTKMQV